MPNKNIVHQCMKVWSWFCLCFQHTGCEWLGGEKTKDMGLYLPDRCQLFDDEEVTDKEIFGKKMLFMDENLPQLNTCAGIYSFINWHDTILGIFKKNFHYK